MVFNMRAEVRADVSYVEQISVDTLACGTCSYHAEVVQRTRVVESFTRQQWLWLSCAGTVTQAPATQILIGWIHVRYVVHVYWIRLCGTQGSCLVAA